MAFNLPHFLRRTPRPSLKEYFRFRSIGLAAGFEWSAAQQTYLDGLRAEVENLPDDARERVYQDFEHADMLADEPGQLAIRSVFVKQAEFVAAIEALNNSEARSLAALMEDEASFRKALAARLADRLRNGRSYSGFEVTRSSSTGGGSPTEAGLPGFEADVRAIFKKLDGSGRKLSIDRFERDRPDTPGRFTQYTVFVEGLPQASNEFEADRLVPRARRPVFEAALCHDPAGGTVDVVCKGGRGVRLNIARAFMHWLLGSESDPKAVKIRSVHLDGLKSRMPFASDPGDGIRRVAVTLLRLRDADESFGRITLEVGSETDDEDIWTRSDEWFEDSDPLTFANWSVTQASLRIEFHPDNQGGPAKVMSVDLRTPHGTNVKDLPRRYAAVIEKNLLRWGYCRMRPAEDRKKPADLLDLICDLIELPRRRLGAWFRETHGAEAERLATMGLVRPGSAPRTIACRACEEDHPARPEFDSVAGRYFHFCPVAGRVEIELRDLDTFEVRQRAMVDLLIAAFPVLPAIARELAAGRIWHLGEAVVGRTSLTLIFACRVGSQQALGALARAVATVPVTEIGMIVTTSPLPDAQLTLPHRYTVVSLRDIASVQEGRLEINRNRVGAHIRAARTTQGQIRAGGGRPSDQDLVVDAYHRRREHGEPFVSFAAEARAIVTELARAYPDRKPPGVSTVRGHLRKLRPSKS